MSASRSRAGEFLAPVPLAMVAVMAVNDAWLKPAFDNAITGKLSDLAICFFLPLYLSALLDFVTQAPLRARLAAGALMTLAVFIPIKTSDACVRFFLAAMEWVGAPLGMPHMAAMADATDLVACALVPCAFVYATSRERSQTWFSR